MNIGEMEIMGEEEQKNFITRAKFSMMVEESVLMNSHGYMDAIILLCEENNLELEDAKKFLSTAIVSKLEVEAIRLNFLEGEGDYTPLE